MTVQPTPRLDFGRVTPEAFGALHDLASSSAAKALESGLDGRLLELVRLRASQINGCRFCIELHSRQALAGGEDDARLRSLADWRDSPLFDEDERAALALAERVTLVHTRPDEDEVYRAARHRFGETRLAHLLWTITVINAYNRLAIATTAA
ncbi:carboxymuconolactone decarboxylase family protein [Saccharopolyspora phatthalungensis]|uniref:AhpD family alkylhydroperoxidase n=1 Tax=Saccharopolyspora phatthalungensis TaxID=664693 RepID=A0A840QFE1_9PSEU|nr:carboxymuconolactone decarboxylase family protein [Saccharopolyspora phatthalungensis]MBB5158781.1 AhpD family alkylhydroperoxidase [Saccharopolyspora phatthalungensis]